MWLPITTFFALGYEHSIVNMYVIPTGMLLGAPVSVSKWWFWNQIPVTLGNIVSRVLLTAAPLFASYYSKLAVVVEEETIIENPPEVAAAS
jgi:formate/nitrite transporter FocA (FNT family)